MQAQIISKPTFTVVGKLIHTDPKSPEISNLWQEFGSWIGSVQNWAESEVSYGVMQYDEESHKLDYMCCVAIEPESDLPAGLSTWEVPANTYAVFETTLLNIGETFDYIYGSWVNTSGHQLAAGPSFERYGETFDPSDPTSKLSIYIPIEK